MSKVFIVVAADEKDKALKALGELGLLHLSPLHKLLAMPDDELLQKIKKTENAIGTIENAYPRQENGLPYSAEEAVERISSIIAKQSELMARLALLRKRYNELELWGDVKLEDIAAVEKHGLNLAFVIANAQDSLGLDDGYKAIKFSEIEKGRQYLYCIISEKELEPHVLNEGILLELPECDRPSLALGISQIENKLEKLKLKLEVFAVSLQKLKTYLSELEVQAKWQRAERGAMQDDRIFALEGWLPKDKIKQVESHLKKQGVDAALKVQDAEPDDLPPTSVSYSKFAAPMRGLFQVLGTVPGYREFDISWIFVIALPIFSAMLISDGGYGLLMLVLASVFLFKVKSEPGRSLLSLAAIIGALSIVWGLLISSFFGLSSTDLSGGGGALSLLGVALDKFRYYRGDISSNEVIEEIMRLSFYIGAIHMSLAYLWKARRLFPRLEFISAVGWAVFMWGMLKLVLVLVLEDEFGTDVVALLSVGGILAIIFARPSKNPLKMLAAGLASFPLDALGALSNTISYIRLTAVGLASSILAMTFNGLAAEVASSATWIAGALLLIFGHGLNIGLVIIALFAHGVRLNMLEFSQCLGMAWDGYAYKPFSTDIERE